LKYNLKNRLKVEKATFLDADVILNDEVAKAMADLIRKYEELLEGLEKELRIKLNQVIISGTGASGKLSDTPIYSPKYLADFIRDILGDWEVS